MQSKNEELELTPEVDETYAEVCSFISSYGGDNPFLLNLKSAFVRWGRLTDKQLSAAWEVMHREEAEPVAIDSTRAKALAETICIMEGEGRKAPSVTAKNFRFKANGARNGIVVEDTARTYTNRYKQEKPYFYASIVRKTGEVTWGGRTTTEEREAVAALIKGSKVK